MTLNTKLALNSAILVLYFAKDAVNMYASEKYLLGTLATFVALVTVSEIVQYYYLRKFVLAEMESKNVDGQ